MEAKYFSPKYVVPSLDELISPESPAHLGPYNRSAFVEFLLLSHCMENLEFILEIDKFLAKARLLHEESAAYMNDSVIHKTQALAHHWSIIYKVFLNCEGVKELNVPCKNLEHFQAEVVPSTKELLAVRKIVYELLSGNYNDFVHYKRELQLDSTRVRRTLEIVAPETVVGLAPEMHHPRVARHNSTCCLQNPCALLAQWDKALDEYETKTDASVQVFLPQNRAGSTGTLSSTSRGSSIGSLGSIIDNIKDYSGWKKTVKKLRTRRASLEKHEVMLP